MASSQTIFKVVSQVGQLRRRGDETAAAALEHELDALVARADRVSFGLAVGEISDTLRGIHCT